MRKQKMYKLDILTVLKTEVNKFKQVHNNETTLDKILMQAKKEIMPLINLGYSYKDIAIIFKNAGIEISTARLKKLYSTSKTKAEPNKISKGDLTTKEQSIVIQTDKQNDNT